MEVCSSASPLGRLMKVGLVWSCMCSPGPSCLCCSSAVKRLMKEAAELREPTEHYHAQPLEVGPLLQELLPCCKATHTPDVLISTLCLLQDNLFEWHFSVRGPPDSEFDGGVYHGRIVLPPEYPMKPPSIILLTVSCSSRSPYRQPDLLTSEPF